MIDALMQRVAAIAGDEPALDGQGGCREWTAWAIADVMLSRGEHRRCAQWLSFALQLLHREPDLVWQAEYTTTAGALAVAGGDPTGARSFLRVGFPAWQAIADTFGSHRALAVGSSVEALVRSLLGQCGESIADLEAAGPEMMSSWLNDRFVPRTLLAGRLLMTAAAKLDDTQTVEATGDALLDWLPRVLEGPSLAVVRAEIQLLLGRT